MKKKPSRTDKNKSAAPQAAQLDAVRKLSRNGRHTEAHARVAELRAHFPDFKPLLALAWEVDDNAGDYLAASLRAWDWSMASPGSLAALEALRNSAFDANLPSLGASASQRLAQAEGKPFPEIPPLRGPLADLSFDQAVAIDLSRMFLTFNRFGEAITVLEGCDHSCTRNNLGLARFAQCKIAEALAGYEANWQQDMRNLFALHQVLRLRLWTGGRELACELSGALRDAQALRGEDAYGQMFGLLLLGLHDEAIAAWRVIRDAEFWSEENDREKSVCTYFAGLAALRTGDVEAAGKLFFEALDFDPNNKDASTASAALMFRAVGKEFDVRAGEFRDWFPQTWTVELKAAKGAQAQEAIIGAQRRRCDAHPDYLAIAAELGGTAVRFYAMSILKARAQDGDAAALDTLRKLLTRPCGPDQVRMDLDLWLKENSFVDTSQAQQLLIRGEVQELALSQKRLHSEQTDIGLPPAAQARLDQMHQLLRQADLQGGMRIAKELAAAYPQQATLAGNIASIKEALGHDLDEVEAQFQRAAELDPAYFFAQAGLARIAARNGDTERARELLKPLHGHEEYHFSEWRAILLAERAIALAQQDMNAVFEWDDALETLKEQFG